MGVGEIGHGGLLSLPDKGFWACQGYLPPDIALTRKSHVSLSGGNFASDSWHFRTHPGSLNGEHISQVTEQKLK